MGNTICVYGASDDLVEVEGLVSEEFNFYDKSALVTIKADGTTYATVLLAYDFDEDGEWRIVSTFTYNVDAKVMQVVPARGEGDGSVDADGCPGYSDKAVIDMGSLSGDRIEVTAQEAPR